MNKYYIFLLAFSVCNGLAAQPFTVTIEKYRETDNFIISISNPLASKVHLTLKDKQEHAIWQESILYAEKVRKVLYLGSLDAGDYSMEVTNFEETREVPIHISGKDKAIHPENGKTLLVGFSKPKSDQSIDIIVQNKLGKNVSLRVFKNKSLFLEQDLGKAEITKKIFKLPETEAGEFVVRVGNSENTYLYKVTR